MLRTPSPARLSVLCVVLVLASVMPVSAQRISAELETSQLSVISGVAEATFKVVVKNEEETSLAGVWLVFADGFEVAIGDVAAEGSATSESTTRTFDLSLHSETLSVPLEATLRYAVNGNAVEQATTVVLRLGQ